MLEVGVTGHQEMMVTDEVTAKHMRSGGLLVFSTPYMVALMESTCFDSVEPFMEEGYSTVGTSLEIKHVSSTPVGMKVWVDSKLNEIDRKRLVFEVNAYDEKGLIGTGRHERFIIHVESFLDKTKEKLDN